MVEPVVDLSAQISDFGAAAPDVVYTNIAFLFGWSSAVGRSRAEVLWIYQEAQVFPS